MNRREKNSLVFISTHCSEFLIIEEKLELKTAVWKTHSEDVYTETFQRFLHAFLSQAVLRVLTGHTFKKQIQSMSSCVEDGTFWIRDNFID